MSTRRSARLSARDLTDINDDQKDVKSSKIPMNNKISEKVKKFKIAQSKTVLATPAASRGKRKAVKEEEEEEEDTSEQAAPLATPLKRSKKETNGPVTVTKTDPVTPVAKKSRARPVNPKAINAPLQTPGGSRVIKPYPSDLLEQTPNAAASVNLTTIDNLLEKATAHLLAIDPRLQAVIGKHTCTMLTPDALQEQVEPFNALCSSIISQQVSGAAAASIKRKFISLFVAPADTTDTVDTTVLENFFPTPKQVAAKSLEILRTAGLSGRKAEYISGLAQKFAEGELSAQMLIDASDEELLEKLIAVRGLGRWSVEMFAFFALKRLDIFSTGDLGVQRGMAAYVGRDISKLKAKGGGKWKYMKEEEMVEIASRFVPYRSLFMWYMWRMEDINLDALGG